MNREQDGRSATTVLSFLLKNAAVQSVLIFIGRETIIASMIETGENNGKTKQQTTSYA
jgi:hypothetical protein